MCADRRTRCCRFHLESQGFVRATVDEGTVFDLQDAREALALTWVVADEQRRGVLVDLRGIRAQSREARAYFGSAEVAARVRAVALLVDSPLSRMIGNFFLRASHPRVPTRLFSGQSEAEAWLVGLAT